MLFISTISKWLMEEDGSDEEEEEADDVDENEGEGELKSGDGCLSAVADDAESGFKVDFSEPLVSLLSSFCCASLFCPESGVAVFPASSNSSGEIARDGSSGRGASCVLWMDVMDVVVADRWRSFFVVFCSASGDCFRRSMKKDDLVLSLLLLLLLLFDVIFNENLSSFF